MATTYSFTGCETQNDLENPFEGIVPRSLPLSPTLSNEAACDVFINHRGIDVKYTIASCIYHTLDLMGVVAFLDKESLDGGHLITAKIKNAIRSALVHVAIFSENYASSPWCLAELSYMLKTRTTIIPVFYHVEPSDLRWTAKGRGLYADAFSQYEANGRYGSEKLREWKMALNRVSYLSGYIFNDTNRDEGRLLKNVVECVLKEMKKVPLEVALKRVPLEEPRIPPEQIAQDFETAMLGSLQREENEKIADLGGTARSGFTLLENQLYNGKRSSMDSCTLVYADVDGAFTNSLNHHKKLHLGFSSLIIDKCPQRDMRTSTDRPLFEQINVAFTSVVHQSLRVVKKMVFQGVGSKQESRIHDIRHRLLRSNQANGSQNIMKFQFLPNPTNRQARSVMYDVSKYYHDTVVGSVYGCVEGATKHLASKIDEIHKCIHHDEGATNLLAILQTRLEALENRFQHLEST